jgi:hypothetical protein
MLGAMMTFLAVCAIVAVYMFIVHLFLRAAEEPEDDPRLEQERATRAQQVRESSRESPRHPRWAH